MEENRRSLRCAIYTRKSTEEGLEEQFNTLQAQREAAEAYIRSQHLSGWIALPDVFDDGGFTGANMDRPALEQLLAASEARRVDCVVVYKVDRLSRSLLDFARLMALFDRYGVSFVSVTQEFNTTTSLGRLTLNILLSFAQPILGSAAPLDPPKSDPVSLEKAVAAIIAALMLWLITAVFTWLQGFVRSRYDLGLEIVALRHQLVVLKRRTKRPRLHRSDRLFWILLRQFWPHWAKSLLIVRPETVVGWYRQALRLYWRFRSRSKTVGRPTTSGDIRSMIQTMAHENLTRGAPASMANC